MEIEILKYYKNIEIPDSEIDSLLNVVKWKTEPQFKQPGRTAYMKINAKNKTKNEKYYYAKIKGIGFWNPKNNLPYRGVHDEIYIENPTKPNVNKEYEYTANIPHVGIDNYGNFTTKHSAPVPLGGITLEKANNEYENALRLQERGVSSTSPYLLVKIKNLSYNSKELGVVVTLVPCKYLMRLNQMFYSNGIYGIESEKKFLLDLNSSFFSNLSFSNFELLVGKIMYLYGSEMFKFSKAGIFRHSGGLDNLYFNIENKKVVFTDLDSSLFLDNIKEPRRSLEILRDISSCIVKFTERAKKKSDSHNKSIKKYFACNPFMNFYKGYFKINQLTSESDLKLIANALNKFAKLYSRDHSIYNKKTFSCLIIFLTNRLLKSNNINFLEYINSNSLKGNIKSFLNHDELNVFNKFIN